MELAILSTAFGEVYKFLAKKFGSEKTKKMVFVAVFVGSFVFVLFQNSGIITKEMLTYWGQTYLMAVGIYEVVVKRLVYPAIEMVSE